MNYYEYEVVIAYRDLDTFQTGYTGFIIEDTDDQAQVNTFLGTLKSNCKYELIAVEVDRSKINFNMFTDPRVINTIH